jgi:hypothetical protein
MVHWRGSSSLPAATIDLEDVLSLAQMVPIVAQSW